LTKGRGNKHFAHYKIEKKEEGICLPEQNATSKLERNILMGKRRACQFQRRSIGKVKKGSYTGSEEKPERGPGAQKRRGERAKRI